MIFTTFAARNSLKITNMAVTEFKRKARRNYMRPQNKQQSAKILLWKPIIKKIDIEELKAQFAS
jgi:hypothetical protein